MKKVIYYTTYDEDVITNKSQNYKLKKDYKWLHKNRLYNFFSNILYTIARLFSYIYFKFIIQVKIENKEVLEKYRNQGYFIYGNHTQTIKDVFLPAYVNSKKRIYTIANPANLGIKIIGKILPILGAIPTPENINDTKNMVKTINTRIQDKHSIVIFPEAHVWPYYTKIRPFKLNAFSFPIYNNSPSFVITTTYYKRKFRKKPGIKIYVDGPFIPKNDIGKRERKEKLCQEIYQCMKERCKNSTYEYIEYKREK